MKALKPLIIILAILLVGYGLVYIFHPMPFIIKLDIEAVEVTDRHDIIIYKTEDPKKVEDFLNLFKYNTPYLPWQQSSSWKKLNQSATKMNPEVGFIFKNDLGAVRYSFLVRFEDPAYVHIRSGFFLPWSKTYYPTNPKIADWRTIKDNK